MRRGRDARSRVQFDTLRAPFGPRRNASGRYTTAGLDPRRRQAHPPALARGVPHGGTATRHGARREDPRRGVFRHGRRGLRAPLLRRPPRAPGSGNSDRVEPRRVHLGGALQPPRGAVLPPADRAHRRRAGGPPDQLLPARGAIRVRRAAAPRPPEPRARPGMAGHRSGAQDGTGRAPRPALHRRDRGPPREARAGHLEAAHREVPVLDDHVRPRGRADRQPVRPVGDERHLVRRRRRPRPRRRARTAGARSASRASAARSSSRPAASATSAFRPTST